MLSALHTPSIGLGVGTGKITVLCLMIPDAASAFFLPFLLIFLFVPEITNPDYVLQSYCPGVFTPRDLPKAVEESPHAESSLPLWASSHHHLYFWPKNVFYNQREYCPHP